MVDKLTQVKIFIHASIEYPVTRTMYYVGLL